MAAEAQKRAQNPKGTPQKQTEPQLGALADTNIFSYDMQVPRKPKGESVEGKPTALTAEDDTYDDDFEYERNIGNMERVLNPRPNARANWQRKMVIRHIRRGGRLTKEMVIARTERKHQTMSHFYKTSIKKLMPLARQIAGKPLDEAILQMRFSKKQVAQDVKEHLIQARNEAIVEKGMGGHLTTKAVILDPSTSELRVDPNDKSKYLLPGEKQTETDMYVAQAWVNRGKDLKAYSYRARGRINILRHPHTSITVLLKEEKTRTREQTDKEVKAIKKRIGKNSWTQLPDRPVTKQSQYLLW